MQIKYLKALNVFWDNIFKDDLNKENQTLIKLLKDIPLFSVLDKRELKTVASLMYERGFEKGEFMFETGQPGAAMFVILDGEVKIVREANDGALVELATLGKGDFLGELALLDSSPRSASALANERTKAMAIFREDLNKLLDTHPVLGGKVMKELAITIGKRLKATNDLLMNKENDSNE